MLQVSNLNAWYGASHVLQDISLEVAKGEIVCLIGRNGAGKTTTLKSIMGLMDKTRGSVTFKDKELSNEPAHLRFRLGSLMCRKNGASCKGFRCGKIFGWAWWRLPKRKGKSS